MKEILGSVPTCDLADRNLIYLDAILYFVCEVVWFIYMSIIWMWSQTSFLCAISYIKIDLISRIWIWSSIIIFMTYSNEPTDSE